MRKIDESNLDTSKQSLASIQMINAQEEERKRIARELHDGVTQDLIGLLIDLRVLKNIEEQESIHYKITQMEKNIITLLKEIKNTAVNLRMPESNENSPVEDILQSYFSWFERNFELKIHFKVTSTPKLLSKEIQTVMYRICQESIYNAYKYANVQEIVVELHEEKESLVLAIIDQGNGFDLVNNKGQGLGIVGMKERAELVNCRFSISSTKGKGTTVKLLIPIKVDGLT